MANQATHSDSHADENGGGGILSWFALNPYAANFLMITLIFGGLLGSAASTTGPALD